MSDNSEKRTIVLTQDEFEKKLRETHDAVVENVAHLPKMPERLSLSELVNLTAVWRLGDLRRFFPPIPDTHCYSNYPVFADDGKGEGHSEAYFTRADKLTQEQRREMADTMRRLANALGSLSFNLDLHAHLLSPASRGDGETKQ